MLFVWSGMINYGFQLLLKDNYQLLNYLLGYRTQLVGGLIGAATLENNLAESVKAEHIHTLLPRSYLGEDVYICAQKGVQECS